MLSGLDGLHVTDGGGADVTSSDATDEGASDAGIDVGACESGTCGAPAGYQPVLFASNRSTECPNGTTTNDAVVDPSVSIDACPCACNYAPSCVPQPNTFSYGGLAGCLSQFTGGQLDGGCNAINTNLGTGSFHLQMGPFAPSNACTNVAKPGQASAPQGRICTLSSCSACPSLPGFSLCYAKNGDVSCPTGMSKHAIGTDAGVACTACTACTSTAKCKGTLGLFDDNQCSSSLGSLTVDGTCQGFNSNKSVNSVKYVPALDQGTCTPGTSDASVAITGLTTICCP